MKEYNAAFFSLYENWFKLLKKEFGEEKAIDLFRKAMEAGLSKAYGESFKKGLTSEFVKLVGERDNNVGLLVKFPEITENKLIYQFHTDPFPNLKNEVSSQKLDDTYIAFKVRYILGDEWRYKNTTHLWNGDSCTEFVISK
ncbi:MAG: hypothetical protein JO149_07755 [Gammaproteobacteria bacterium]|nr:hypothetical protein [Gammaproteobacteria bacterium]